MTELMPTQKTLREIIEWLIDEIDKREGMFVRRSDKDIDYAISEIKSLLKEKLSRPIKSEIRIAKPLCEISFNKGRIVGHNSVLTEIEQIIENL